MSNGSTPTHAALRAEDALARFAMTLPEVVEENPWGHRAMKVRGKTFVFLGADGDQVSLSVKLPESGAIALSFEFAEPTGYGLGKSGWVSARFVSAEVPTPMVHEWLLESYRAIAPKKLGALVFGQAGGDAPRPAATGGPKKTAPKKVAPKKATPRKTRTSR